MIAIGSFLLLAACDSQGADGRPVSMDGKELPSKEDRKSDEKKAEDAGGGRDSGAPSESTSGFPAMADDGGYQEPATDGAHDGCEKGQMIFEGDCMAKDAVQEILDERGREAVIKVRKARKPKEQAQAAHELIEQQIYQMDKTGDDLDEIIEQLRQENREQEMEDKKNGKPD